MKDSVIKVGTVIRTLKGCIGSFVGDEKIVKNIDGDTVSTTDGSQTSLSGLYERIESGQSEIASQPMVETEATNWLKSMFDKKNRESDDFNSLCQAVLGMEEGQELVINLDDFEYGWMNYGFNPQKGETWQGEKARWYNFLKVCHGIIYAEPMTEWPREVYFKCIPVSEYDKYGIDPEKAFKRKKKEPEETFMGLIPYIEAKKNGIPVSEFQDECWKYGAGLKKNWDD